MQCNDRYATTSAALKLLLLRLTGRGPGRWVVLDAGTTTADAPVVIQASELGFDFVPAAISAKVLVALFRLVNVGSLDGVGDGGGWGILRDEGAPTPLTAVLRVIAPAANLGILFGGCADIFFAALVAVEGGFRWLTATADRRTRVGRCSDAVPLAPVCRVAVLARCRVTGGAAPRAGRVSSASSPFSSSESTATRFAIGVFLGCPGGAIACALAAAAATCRLGVTGGKGIEETPLAGGVILPLSPMPSSCSAGGVTGVTTGTAAAAAAACDRLSSSIAAHLAHSNCLRYMYCCCGPTTLPGRTIRIKAMASAAVNPYFQTR